MRDKQQVIDRLEARAQITDLLYRYAHAVHAADADTCIGLFTSDASFEVLESDLAAGAPPRRHSHLVGREALLAFFRRSLRAGEIFPLVHDILVEVRGDEASSRCVMAGAAPDGAPRFMGVYSDRFRRDAEWLFTSRIFTILQQRA